MAEAIRGIMFHLHEYEDLSNHIKRERDFFEAEILDYLAEHHHDQKHIVDIGANIGNHSVFFANFLSYTKITCFEPIPTNFDLLVKNMAPYLNVFTTQVALSDHIKKLRMHLNQDNYGASKVDKDGPIYVSAKTLDSLRLADVTLIKIDVEGHEPQVLAGAKNTIDRDKPLVLIEDWYQQYGELLPNHEIEKAWPHHATYLYRPR